MPNYGLDHDQRGSRPWGLDRSVLEPGKVITDPVHGDIHLTTLEVAVIDSRPFQRLRRIRQLGNTHFVYPGAVHTRFSHCLGALKVAQVLLDVIWNQSAELNGVKDDLFAQWRKEKGDSGVIREWAQATVLARLGALLHDLCHVPAGHTVEDDLRILEAHDENKSRFADLWALLVADVPDRLRQLNEHIDSAVVVTELLDGDGMLHCQLRPLILSKGGSADLMGMTYPFCADLVGNTICADLLDYLDRDHLYAGLPESIGRRFTSAFFVTPSARGSFSERLALNIVRNDHERTDIVSELLKALRYRYELSERVLTHRAKLAADAMLGESIERWEWALWWRQARKVDPDGVGALESREDFEIGQIPNYREQLEKAAGRDEMRPEVWAEAPLGRARGKVQKRMERKFQRLGDDGLLEYLAGLGTKTGEGLDSLWSASAGLAGDLRDRRLFRTADRVGAGDVAPTQTYDDYGDPVARAALEAGAQSFAGLGFEPKVLLWIPEPRMRVKQAEVLVRQQAGIAPFATYEKSRSRRGSDIYDSHERLWAAYVFVHRDLTDLQEQMVCAYLARKMGIRWEQHRHLLGPRPDEWPMRLAVSRVFEADFESEVEEMIEAHEDALKGLAARMSIGETFAGLCREVEKVKDEAESGGG